jgi:hypothetical protein
MDGNSERPVWVSGSIQTPLNKFVFPAAWLAVVIGLPLWVLATTGRLSIAREFYFIGAFVLAATVPLLWVSLRIHAVGYRGRELLISNYFREARIPFEQVEAVERVWWYRGSLVRIVFRTETPFGGTVYYLPKWGPLRCLWSSPERELRDIIV